MDSVKATTILKFSAQATNYLMTLFKGFREHIELAKDSLFVQSFYDFAAYAKPFDGYSRNNEPKMFYDEREWRYVPRIPNDQWFARLSKESFIDQECQSKAEAELDGAYKLRFNPSDIRYLIVDRHSEILNLANQIPDIKQKYDRENQLLLTTKIVTMESIEEDF